MFLLRLALAILFLAHAGLKIFVFTPAGTAQFFGSVGLPPALAYITIAWELIGAARPSPRRLAAARGAADAPILLGAILSCI